MITVNLYRQFQTYIRNYGDNKIYKICWWGAIVDDYNWDLDQGPWQCGLRLWMLLTLHYYTTIEGGFWVDKGAAALASASMSIMRRSRELTSWMSCIRGIICAL
jgi:alpha-N-arabinofuranosidase